MGRGGSFAEAYAELCVIGRGSFGEVLKVRRRADSKTLVCKVLSYGQMSEKEKQLVVSEVNILRELKHRHVVQYFDRVIDKRAAKIYIIMEYCENGDMGRLIKRMRRDRTHFEETRIWKCMAQLLLAFEACHQRKDIILHRDIKPCNIFLDRDMNIKVGDFGLAKELGAESQFAYTNVGTPYYMSPELINEKRYNEKSDIWALGCLVYEMCALRPPFEAANVVSLGKRISAGRFSRIPVRYSDELQAVIQAMLTLSPAKRPSVGQLMRLPRVGSYVARARESVSRAQPRADADPAKSSESAVLAAREKEVRNKEHALRAKEKDLADREHEIRHREDALRDLEDALAAREVAVKAREARAADLEADLTARKRKSAVTAATTPTSASETLSTLSHGSLADHALLRIDASATDDDDDDDHGGGGVEVPEQEDFAPNEDAEREEILVTPRYSSRPQRTRPATGSGSRRPLTVAEAGRGSGDRRRGVISRGSPPIALANPLAPRRATPSSAQARAQRRHVSPKYQQENLAPRPASSGMAAKVSPGLTKPRPATSARRSPLQQVTPSRQPRVSRVSSSSTSSTTSPPPSGPGSTRPTRASTATSASATSSGSSGTAAAAAAATARTPSSRHAELAAARARGIIHRDFVSRHEPAAFRQHRVPQLIPR